jgi:nitrite reductase/ring-hydroxylating ferredoxin subunit
MAEEHNCDGCDVGSRREFVLEALRVSAAVVAALGLGASAAEAMPVRWISAMGSVGSEKTYPIPANDGVQIDKDNDVIVARVGKKVFGFLLACPHQNTALRWEAGDNRFQCPKHKTTYTPEGVFIEGRATRSMDRYAVKLSGNTLVVDIDKVYQEDTDKAEWTRSFVTLS